MSPEEDRRLRAAIFAALDDVRWPDMDERCERTIRRYRGGVYRAIHQGVDAWLTSPPTPTDGGDAG